MMGLPFVQLVPFQLKEGVDEATLLQASDTFQRVFVDGQPGVQRRLVLRASHGGYADLVIFESKAHADRVAAEEATSEAFRALLSLVQPLDPGQPQPRLQSFELLRGYA